MAMMRTGAPATAINTETIRGYQDALAGKYEPPTDATALEFYNKGQSLGKDVKEGKAQPPVWA